MDNSFDTSVGLGRRVRCGFGASALLSSLVLLSIGAPAAGQQRSLSETLRGRIEAGRAVGRISADGHDIRSVRALPAFYEARGFEPAWLLMGAPGLDYRELRMALERAPSHGLEAADYWATELDALAPQIGTSQMAAVDFELLATDAFLILGSHLLMGRVNPETIDPEWIANRRTSAMDTVLARALSAGGVARELELLAPQQVRYGTLVAALARLRATTAEGGWPAVAAGEKLEVGVVGPRVLALRARLEASNDLRARALGDPREFDAPLAEAVVRFQARHGLEADGVVGSATVAALNVPSSERARQVAVNLERWRWLPADLGARHIEVNIAGFDVRVMENGRAVRQHRAIVGREYRQTPMFSGTISYLVLAPYWHVPPSIASVDKLPLLKADPLALVPLHYALLQQATNTPVDFASVDWTSMSGGEFNRRYRLRQDPGPQNALGTVKFMFPNKHNVYLHDTPSRELFARAARSFSSGCIRTENPLDLAEYLLADQSGWSRARIDAVVASGVEQTVRLTRGVPVHLLYWTAWADADGTIHFRDDIYGRDRAVWSAIVAEPPGA